MASCARAAVLACALLLLAPALALGGASAGASVTERRALAEINDFRVANGVPPVRPSRSLARSAGRFATHILRVDRLHHHSEVWTTSRFRTAGENLAAQPGNRRDAGRALKRWASSPAHRHILLNPRYTWGGVGREYGRLGRKRATVWVLQLGRR